MSEEMELTERWIVVPEEREATDARVAVYLDDDQNESK